MLVDEHGDCTGRVAHRDTEVAGRQVPAGSLIVQDVLKVLTREAKKRREAAEAFDAAGRDAADFEGRSARRRP